MRYKLLFLLLLSVYFPFELFAQFGTEKGIVIVSGKVVHYKQGIDPGTLNISFRELVKRDPDNTYTAEIDNTGNFSFQFQVLYPLDIYIHYINYTNLICAPGDNLQLEIDNSRSPETSIRVVGGNRVKDNRDYQQFIIGKNNIYPLRGFDLAKDKSATAYTSEIQNRESNFRHFLTTFKEQNNTSELFNRIADDYLKYETWLDLILYPEFHAQQNNIEKDVVKLPTDYYDFLRHYNMNDKMVFSFKHVDFLRSYNRYVMSIPTDSMKKAYDLFKKQDIVAGAEILRGMILNNTSGFTRNLCLTKFYLDAIDGKQLTEFEALYDSSTITDSFFKQVIKEEYRKLQKFMDNQITENANIKTINGKVVKNVIDTISSKYAGKVIYIDFWAPWCGPCMAEMPNSQKLQEDYKNKEVVFLYLANRCKADAWKATIANKNMTGEHILLTDDQYNVLAAQFGISGIPHYVLIDRQGNIVSKSAFRPGQREMLKEQIDRLLE